MNKFRKYMKVLALATALMMIPVNAFGATLYSSWYSIPASALNDPANVSYQYRASLRIETGYAVGTAQIYGDKNIPQSYAGALAEIYNSTGKLLNASHWNYNNSGPVKNLSANTTYNGSGSMYCKATFGVWSSVGEKIYTAKTSSGIVKSVQIISDPKTNKNGLTYGSGLSKEEVTLIWAEGNHGQEGYVYRQDLYGTPAQNRQDFLKKIATYSIAKTIPVYDKNGSNVIDYFTVGN